MNNSDVVTLIYYLGQELFLVGEDEISYHVYNWDYDFAKIKKEDVPKKSITVDYFGNFSELGQFHALNSIKLYSIRKNK